MRAGFSLDELGAIWNVHPNRASQAGDHAIRRVAQLYRVDAAKTMAAILDAIERLEPMSDDEIELRAAMGRLQLDRRRLHPKAKWKVDWSD